MPRAERETVRVSRVRKKQVIWPVLQESERQLNVCWEGGVDSLTHTHTRLLSRFFKRWKCGLIVSRGRFLIISVTTSYIIGITKVRSLLVFLPSLFLLGFEFNEKRISLSPPFHVSGMEDVGSRNPLGLLIFPTNYFWLCYRAALYFLAMASFVSPPLMCQRRRVILRGGEHVGCYGYRPP
jgi:hypothetical protein